jgi:hypothetical protein
VRRLIKRQKMQRFLYTILAICYRDIEAKRNRNTPKKNPTVQKSGASFTQTLSRKQFLLTNLSQRSNVKKRDCGKLQTKRERDRHHSFVRFIETLAREVRRPVTMSSECRRTGSGFNVSNFGVRLVAMSARVLANQSIFAPLSSNMVSAGWCTSEAATFTSMLAIAPLASSPNVSK